MATAIATAEHSDADSQREEFLAFCADSETYAVVDQVVGEMMLQHASIREGGVKEAVKYLSEHRSPSLLLIDLSNSELPQSDVNGLADVCEPGVTVVALR
jgi:pilus assembly protein CpaE